MKGIVKWYNARKGYGFITPDDKTDDVFVHATALKTCGLKKLYTGSEVSFETDEDDKGKRAKSLKILKEVKLEEKKPDAKKELKEEKKPDAKKEVKEEKKPNAKKEVKEEKKDTKEKEQSKPKEKSKEKAKEKPKPKPKSKPKAKKTKGSGKK